MQYRATLGLAGLLLTIAAACASTTDTSPSAPTPDAGTGAESDSGASTPSKSCERVADCTDGPPCTEAKCHNQLCEYEPLTCKPANECSESACDPTENKCKVTPKPDGTECSTGACAEGTCKQGASCFGDDPQQYLHCDGTSSSTERSLSTTFYESSRVSKYTCATGETTAEAALEFDPPGGANVTVTLQVIGGADADIDLIILENTCDSKAKCVNATAGSGFAGITAGTGNETVAFTAEAGKKYYIVVDGKVTTNVNYKVTVNCN